jgi:hypothetical protein
MQIILGFAGSMWIIIQPIKGENSCPACQFSIALWFYFPHQARLGKRAKKEQWRQRWFFLPKENTANTKHTS